MAKINYTKVEEAIERLFLEGLVKRLHHFSKIMENFSSGPPLLERKPPDKEAVVSALQQLNEVISKIRKHNKELYSQLNVDTLQLRRLMREPHNISYKDWDDLQTLRIKAMKLLTDLQQNSQQNSQEGDQALIEKQKKTHKTKRFNVRDKWWPV